MGRKTWDSIPPRFRPLKGRVNVVVSRSHATSPARAEEEEDGDGPVRVSSLEQAVAHLHAAASSFSADAPGPSRAFVIGGAQMYAAALQLREARRVLLTRVLEPDFACDTFFPLVLSEAGGGGWVRRSKEELDAWAGETVPEGVQEENGTRYEFQMWERV
ncbi:dihydrofolate reductase-like domain-containing protein, partial [Hypoxylon fragiforme]|uniref:dihydrofolate reductase-like domain-containing protein n=1 Tax=Hypoxylon fragiforme TaxID=63214 RepID=UPI0020C67A95